MENQLNELRALGKSFLFQFQEQINSRGEFHQKLGDSLGLITIASYEDSAKAARWVKVVAVGPQVTQFEVGDVVLLPALRWTESAETAKGKVWRSTEIEVVAKERNDSLVACNDFVIANKQPAKAEVSASGIIIAGRANDDTPSVCVSCVGPQADQDMDGATIFYTDQVMHNAAWKNQPIQFIRSDDVIMYTI